MYFNEDFLMRNGDNVPFAQAFSTTKRIYVKKKR